MDRNGWALGCRVSSLTLVALGWLAGWFPGSPRCLAAECESPSPAALDALDLSVEWTVRGVFLRPTDRPFRDCLRERLHTWVTIAQRFFREEMAFEGYRDPSGQGKTFRFERDDDGLWSVVFLVGEHDTAWYQERYSYSGGEAIKEMKRRLPDGFATNNLVIYMYDTAAVEDEHVLYSGQVGSLGYAYQGAHFLGIGFDTVAADAAVSSQREMFEQEESSGIQEWDGSGAFHLLSRGQYASTYVGAALHEMGHGLGLWHVFDDYDGDGIETNLMGNGFRRIGGRYSPESYIPYTRLGWADAWHLRESAFLPPGPPLAIASVVPPEVGPGSQAFVLGEGFAEGDAVGTMEPSVIRLDGEAIETTYVGPTKLSFLLPETLSCGPHDLQVTNRPLATPVLPAVESNVVSFLVGDSRAPDLQCPGDLEVTAAPGESSATVVYPEPRVEDACDPSPLVAFEPPDGSTFPAGRTEVVCTARDASGNATSCRLAVQVRVNRASLALGAVPEAVQLPDGVRLLALAATLGSGPDSEAMQLREIGFRNVGGGDAASLVKEARVILDSNGNGSLDSEDEPVGVASTFAAHTQVLSFTGLDVDLEAGEALSLFLVLQKSEPTPQSSAAATSLVALLLLAMALFSVRSRRVRLGASILLAVSLAISPWGCGGGSSPPAAGSELRIQLESLSLVAERSGQIVEPEGLPLEAWPLRV